MPEGSEALPHERRNAVLDLWKAGATSEAIARRVGYADATVVRHIVRQARLAGDSRAVVRASGRKPHYSRFEQEAARRGMSPAELTKAIQARVTEDNLFAAVLDD